MDDRNPRLNRFLDRAAPALRKVDAAIANNDELRAARDRIAERVADAAQQAADVIKGMGGPEVIEGELHVEPAGAAAEPAAAPTARPVTAQAPHWNRARIGRMVAAAGREAVRPQTPAMTARRAVTIVASMLGLVLLWRLARRR